MLLSKSLLFLASSTLSLTALAQLTLTSKGCVAPAQFNSCYKRVTQIAQNCVKNNCGSGACTGPHNCYSSDKYCYPACISVAYQGWLNCAISSCWNRAYSCEFQMLEISAIMSSIEYLNVLYPPYFTGTDGLPGACSCAMEVLYGNIQNWEPETNQCQARVPSSQADYCACCGASKAKSALVNICPKTDPSSLPFLSQMSSWSAAGANFASTQCKTTYNPTNVNCSADPYDFMVYGRKFYGPQNLPPPGTVSVFNHPGQLAKPTATKIVWSLASGLVPSTAIAAKPTKNAV